jgi:hypothetical protein
MKFGDFHDAFQGENSLTGHFCHYDRCQAGRKKSNLDLELEAVLKEFKNDCRVTDLSNSVRREIRNRRLIRRKVSVARMAVGVLIGSAVVYFVILMMPIAENWFNMARDGLMSIEPFFRSVLAANNTVVIETTDIIISTLSYKGLIGIVSAVWVLSLVFLFIQSKEFLIKLRLLLNR